MSGIVLRARPLTRERFAPYGDVIAAGGDGIEPMNEARFERFSALATADVDGEVAIGIVRSKSAIVFPWRFNMVERHPLGSQAFVPLDGFSFVVVVAPPAESVDPTRLEAFVTNGAQGVNYHRGTWHMPLIAAARGQAFLVIDRAPGAGNCEERVFDDDVILESPWGD
jgi:ureidoglycolate lyase